MIMPKERTHQAEQLDQLDLRGEVLHTTLKELALINRLLGNHRAVRRAVLPIIRKAPNKHWRIIDLGCGGGDVLDMLHRLFEREGVSAEFLGIDGNPHGN